MKLDDIFSGPQKGPAERGHVKKRQKVSKKPTFFCARPFPLFFPPVHPTLLQVSFFPKISSFWDLKSALSSREMATCRGWVSGDGSGRGCPTGKQRKSFLFWRVRKGEKRHFDIFRAGQKKPKIVKFFFDYFCAAPIVGPF